MTKINIQICTKDRATEVALLLQSLRSQTFKDFSITILDDGSITPLNNFYFIQYLINRLKYENNNVKLIRNDIPSGVSAARQQLVDFTLKNGSEDFICRLDDDVIIEHDYLEKLLEVIETGYDIASGVTTPFVNPDMKRENRFVQPIIGRCVLDKEGKLIMNMDDCGVKYLEEEILPAHHFRSCALFKREVFESGVDYNSRLDKSGFREEQILSFKAILKGFKIGVHTGADARHLMTPSGGRRNDDSVDATKFNQNIFEETTKKIFEEHGDFLQNYNEKVLGHYLEYPLERELNNQMNAVNF